MVCITLEQTTNLCSFFTFGTLCEVDGQRHAPGRLIVGKGTRRETLQSTTRFRRIKIDYIPTYN